MVVDVERRARERLKNLLGDIAAELPSVVVAEAGDGVDALERLRDYAADIALIDIRMPRMDGVELARHLSRMPDAPSVIFVTAYDQYAVQAFDLCAIDYLLKPVRAARLLEALRKARRVSADSGLWQRLSPEGRRHLQSTERGRTLLIPVADIVYLRAELKYVTARTCQREYLLEESLTQLEQELGERFVRVHRNCLVAREAISGCERISAEDGESHWAVIVQGIAERLPVSRRQWPQVKTLIRE